MASPIPADKTDMLTEMKILLNDTITNDNKAAIRQFLELMKKCNPVVKVEDKKYPHITFRDNMDVDQLSKDPAIDKVLNMFIPKDGYFYSAYRISKNTPSYKNGQRFESVQINGYDSNTACNFMESFSFDVTEGEEIRFVIEYQNTCDKIMLIRYSSHLQPLNYVVQWEIGNLCCRYSYNKHNVLFRVSLGENDQLAMKFEKSDENEVKVKTINHNNNCVHLIHDCILDLCRNEQQIDVFRLASKYLV